MSGGRLVGTLAIRRDLRTAAMALVVMSLSAVPLGSLCTTSVILSRGDGEGSQVAHFEILRSAQDDEVKRLGALAQRFPRR